MRKLLTIGIPTFNRGEILKLNLDSLVMQIEPYNEYIDIVISDNCSDDNTEKIAKEFSYKKDFIRYYKNDKNIGLNNNVYKIVHEYTDSEFLWIIGDDDMIINGGIPKILSVINNYKNLNGFYINYGKTTIMNREYSIKNNESQYIFKEEEIFGQVTGNIILKNFSELLTKVSNPIAVFFGIASMVVKTKYWKKYTKWDQSELTEYRKYKYVYPHMEVFMRPFMNDSILYIGKPIFMFVMHDRYDGINGKLIFELMKDYKSFWNELNMREEEKKIMNESCNKMILQFFSNELINEKQEIYDKEIMYNILKLVRDERDIFKEALNDIVLNKDKKIIDLLIDMSEFKEIEDLMNIIEILKLMVKEKKEQVINIYYKKISSNLIEKFISTSNEICIWGSSELAYSIYNLIKKIDKNKKIKIVDGYYRNIGKKFYDTNIIIEEPKTIRINSKVIISSVNNYEDIKVRIDKEYADKKCEIL